MRRSRWRRRLTYAIDNAIARRPWMVLLWLGLGTLLVAVLGAVLITLFRLRGVNGLDEEEGFLEAFYQSLTRLLDPGTFSGDVGWGTRLVMLLVTLSGIFVAGALIGLISNVLDQKITELRKGRSAVMETGHTLVLGWSPRVPTIVSELLQAGENQRRCTVVVVADRDKTEMEDELRPLLRGRKNSVLVCRSAEPWTQEALDMGNASQARSIIVTEADSNAETTKVLLALHSRFPVGQAGASVPVVAEVTDARLGESLERLLGERVDTVCSDSVVAALTAQACRQRGLGAVFSELLAFSGCEIYVEPAPDLVGRRFDEIALAHRGAAIIGYEDADGLPLLNPAADDVMQPGMSLLVVAQDDDALVASPVNGRVGAPTELTGTAPPERLTIIGWSELGPQVLAEMDTFLASGTVVEVVVDPELVDPAGITAPEGSRTQLVVTPLAGTPDAVTEHLGGGVGQVIVLGYRDKLDVDAADARSLLTVLALKNARHHTGQGATRTVVELLDERHVSLAEATGADDFVVSDQLTSRMLAQLAETPGLRRVFDCLFGGTGPMLRLRRPEWLGLAGPVTFGDVVATALARGETAIGVVDRVTGATRLSPDKAAELPLGEHDRIVVLA